jgi:hypothetical protein
MSSAGIADATCTSVRGTGASAQCADEPSSFSVQLDEVLGFGAGHPRRRRCEHQQE